MTYRGPSYSCGAKGCNGLAWKDGGECAKCVKQRRSENDRAPEPVETIRETQRRYQRERQQRQEDRT